MASFGGNRFPSPMFNQNFPRNNFCMNSPGNRPNVPFQGPPNPTFRPFQPPERFMLGNFANRPHFSNFPEPAGPPAFRNRLPPPIQGFPTNPPPNFPVPRGPFQRPFRLWNQHPPPPPFEGPRPHLQNRPRAPFQSPQHGKVPFQAHRRGKSKTRQFRKLKDDTTEKPFSCDTCDRAFVTEDELKEHLSQHIKCDHAECTFEAHPKIVALHKKMQHDTGYADRISKLKNDAEIQKWREERKRRFPTAENIKKRKAEQAEKEARGETLETKEFGKFKRRREDSGNATSPRKKRGRGLRRHNERRRDFHPRSQPFAINVESESDSDNDSHITLHRFLGMSSLANSVIKTTDDVEVSSDPHIDSDNHQLPSESSSEQNLPKSNFDDSISHSDVPYAVSSNVNKDLTVVFDDDKLNGQSISSKPINDEEYVHESTITEQSDPPVKDTANQSVCEIPADEFSSEKQKCVELVRIEDSDDESPTIVPIQKSENHLHVDQISVECQVLTGTINKSITLPPSFDTSSKPKVSNSENGFKKTNFKSNRHPRHQHNHVNDPTNGQDQAQGVRKSLLEKLLADDIRHERNVVLQCIRHIVKNNFFGIEKKCHKGK